NPGMYDPEEVFGLLLQAGEVASRDPLAFIDDLFRRMLTLSGHLVLRGHLFLRRQLAVHDRSNRDGFFSYLPRDSEKLLESLRELERHTAEVAERYARTMRLWHLRSRRPAGCGVKGVNADTDGRPGVTTEAGGETEPPETPASEVTRGAECRDRGALGGDPREDPGERRLPGQAGRAERENGEATGCVPAPLSG